MSDENSIRIHKLIVHKVDHETYDKSQPSDLPTPLNEPVRSFLRRHITKSREHKNTRTAVFLPEEELPEDDPSTALACNAILENPDNDDIFVEHSKILAQHLFNQLTGRTSPGDLVVCFFAEGNDDVPWLALLKMDSSEGFRSERKRVDGQWQVQLVPTGEILPSSETDLQKCAFVLPQALRNGYDLKVLDQQNRRYGVRRAVASFFSQGFLQSRVLLNRGDKTQLFFSGSNKWLSFYEMDWAEADVRHFRERLRATLRDQTVDLTAFAEEAISNVDERDDFLDYLRKRGMEDFVFDTDPQEREKSLRYRIFEGDHGLRIRIDAEYIGEGKTLHPYPDPNDEDTTIVYIRTKKWREA